MSNGLKAKVTVSRSGDDLIRIRFRDEASGIQFAEARMTLEEFALAVTGLAEREAELEVTGLQYVGKRRVTEQRSIVCPLDAYNKDKLEEWLKENAQEEGWLLNSYLGSQGSVSTRDGVTILRYSVTKYVDEDLFVKPSPFLQGVHHAYAQTDGSYALPNSREGDLLREAKREIESLRHALKKTDDQAGLLMSVVEKLLQWPEAYPVKVFPEMSDDEWKRAAEVLSGAGLSLDRISASNMRYVALQVRKLAQEGLAAAPDRKDRP